MLTDCVWLDTTTPYDCEKLIPLIAQGDEASFHKLYNFFFNRVYGMALSYLPDDLLAHDMVQEVFVRVWKNRQELSGVLNMEAWIITITRNLLIKELRKQYPVSSLSEINSCDPNDVLDYRELEKLLAQALTKLSVRQQQVYLLSRVEGQSHKQIAGKLHISVDVSREHLSKALHKIRRFLGKNYHVIPLLFPVFNFF